METHTTVVGPDGMIHVPTTEARPGETVTVEIMVQRAPARTSESPHPTDQSQRPDDRQLWRTMSPPERRRALDGFVTRTQEIRDRLSPDERTTRHDWLYDEDGLPH